MNATGNYRKSGGMTADKLLGTEPKDLIDRRKLRQRALAKKRQQREEQERKKQTSGGRAADRRKSGR